MNFKKAVICIDEYKNTLDIIKKFLNELYNFNKKCVINGNFAYLASFNLLSEEMVIHDKLLNKKSDISVCDISINFSIFNPKENSLSFHVKKDEFYSYAEDRIYFDMTIIIPEKFVSFIDKKINEITENILKLNYNIDELIYIADNIDTDMDKKNQTLKAFKKSLIKIFGKNYILNRSNINEYHSKITEAGIGTKAGIVGAYFNKLILGGNNFLNEINKING